MEEQNHRRGRPVGSKNTRPHKPYAPRKGAYTPEQAKLAKYICRLDKNLTKKRMEGITKAFETIKHSQPALTEKKMQRIEKCYLLQCKIYNELNYARPEISDCNIRIEDVMCHNMKPRDVAVRNILKGYITLDGSCLLDVQKKALVVAMNYYYLSQIDLSRKPTKESVYRFITGESANDNFDLVDEYLSKIDKLSQTDKLDFLYYIQYDELGRAMDIPDGDTQESGNTKGVTTLEDSINAAQAVNEINKEEEYRQEILEKISQQRRDAEEYFASRVSYEEKRKRRYSFKVKNRRKTNEEYKEELHQVYGDDYDYSPVHYVDSRTMVYCFCNIHQYMFQRMPQHLLKGYGCPYCNKERGKTFENTCRANVSKNPINKKWTKERFIEESKNLFANAFDYSKVIYVNNDTPVVLIRRRDNKRFKVTPCEHLRHDVNYTGGGSQAHGTSAEEKQMVLVRRLADNDGKDYYVPKQPMSMKGLITLVCPTHGEFQVKRENVHNGVTCPFCGGRSAESIGERHVREYLENKEISFQQEYLVRDTEYFPKCAKPDFFLPDRNIFIEFNGEYHYKEVEGNQGRSLEEQMKRDYQMRRYCADKGIQLIEIPYQFRDDIASYLDKFL